MRLIVFLTSFCLTLLFMTVSAQAEVRFNIGATAIKSEIDDPRYRVENKISTGLNYGLSGSFEKILVNFSTNRFVNYPARTSVVAKNGAILKNKSRSTFDTATISYRFGRFASGVFISNAKIEKSLWKNKSFLASEEKHVVLYGLSETMFLRRNVSVSALITAPNHELFLKNAVVFSLNYYF